jgi:hypothetical protein
MAKVQRGNVVLRVEEFEVKRYLQLGYNLVDESGNVLKEAIPHDFSTLQRYYLEQTAKIAELEDTIAKLTAENTALKKAKSAGEKKPAKPKADN